MGTKFGIEKCVMLAAKKAKIIKAVGKELPDGKACTLRKRENYNYLGIFEADNSLRR